MRFRLKVSILFACFLFLFPLFSLQAETKPSDPLNIYFFYGTGCPHCSQEKAFFESDLKNRYPELVINEYEIYSNRQNALLLRKIAEKLQVDVAGVPFLIIGEETFVGYLAGVTSLEIINAIENCQQNFCPDLVANLTEPLLAEGKSSAEEKANALVNTDLEQAGKKMLKLPILGEVDALSFSLPALTIIIGVLDGFNPCAMWVLIFLIGLLINIDDKRRRWTLGLTFIASSALVYFIFMSAWLNLIIFLGFILWVRLAIATIALIGGGYSLKEYFTNKDASCKVGDAQKKQKTFTKLRSLVAKKSLFLSLLGIIALAFAVNLVELICSAGFPAVYTQVLALNNLASWQNYLYLLLYIFFFMLDDIIVFVLAMITLQITGITTKYSRLSRLIGGLIMLAIGLLLIFKPAWLMFG